MESIEKPSFENFLSKPTTLTDHLMWQLGAVHVKDDVLAAAELIIGNLNDDGYLLSSDEELLEQGAGWLSALEGGAALEHELGEAGAAAVEGEAGRAQPAKPELPRKRCLAETRCTRRWTWCGRWTRWAWPRATCASA